jgi:intraflagellar transport protein 140
MQHKQYKKAINLYIVGGNVAKALELCLQHSVIVTDDMAEKMSPNMKETPEDPKKIAALKQIAKVCKRQGSYHLATKKYTQAKDKRKAMKVLLKSGDTEKIIFFASKCECELIVIPN